MRNKKYFYPSEANLGKNCEYWSSQAPAGCEFPKAEVLGRISCEGMIDDICLWRINGTPVEWLRPEVELHLKSVPATPENNRNLPPGRIKRN